MESIVIPIIVALVMSLPGLYAAFFQARHNQSQLANANQEATLKLITPLNDEIDELRKEVAELEPLRGEVKSLRELVSRKDHRIEELERMVSERDEKIDCLQKEVNDLRRRVEDVETRKRPKT